MRKRVASLDNSNSAKRRKVEMAEAHKVDSVKITEENMCPIYDEMDDKITAKMESLRELSDEEKRIYVNHVGVLGSDTMSKFEILESDTLYGIKGSDDCEHMILARGETLQEVKMECAIMMEPLPPFQIVQYLFEDGVWRLSKIGALACENYRKSKFKHWEDMIKKPVCEASLRRMYEIGLITTLFDHLAFPNPPEMESKYTAINDETQKKVIIPHPVQELRVWNSAERKYVPQTSKLEGAPEADKANQYWVEMVQYLEKYYPESMERIKSGEKKPLD